MKKIKAREILLMNPKLNLIQLKGFRYFAIDKDGRTYVYSQKPTDFINDWAFNSNVNDGDFALIRRSNTLLDWRDSLREIDFSEEETQCDYYPLFLHLSEQHDLTLTDEELHEIVLLAKKIKTNY